MSDEDLKEPPFEEFPEVEIERSRGISFVWLIPLVALVIAAWLGYQTFSEMGPTITLTFQDGEGLEAGKTKIKYKSVDIGLVEDVQISADLSHVIVTAEMSKESEPHLTDHTQFWVVRPQIGLEGISGLDTLVSGAYIATDPRPGNPTTAFMGLKKPPGVTAFEEGGEFRLRAEKLGACYPGAPVFYRGLEVGRILGHELAEDDQSIMIDIFIQAPHHLRVVNTSRFWQRSGLEVTVGTEGLNVKMESLTSLMVGGVAFDSPMMAGTEAKPSQSGTVFPLFENFSSIKEANYVRHIPYRLHFQESVRGLKVGAPVELMGIKVGSVTDIAIKLDPRTLNFEIPVTIEVQPDRIHAPDVLETLDKLYTGEPYQIGKMLIEEHGLRAQLQTGSLLTGQLFVELDFHSDVPKKKMILTGNIAHIPTIPSTLDEFRMSAADILAELRKLPLHRIAHELLGTLEGVNRLANAPELLQAVSTLNETLADVRRLTKDMDRTVGALATSAEQTLKAARGAMELVDPNSPASVNLTTTLEELASAARSIRILADYLEQHPESLVHGKSD